MMRFNVTFIFGFMMAGGVITYGLFAEVGQYSLAVFAHPTALAIVVGGSFACALMNLPVKQLYRVIMRTFFALKYPKDDFIGTIQTIVSVSQSLTRDPFYLEQAKNNIRNTMLTDGIQLINMGFKSEDIRRFLEVRREQNEVSLNQCASFYFSLAKLGPALGLVGTLIGLVILLYYHMGGGDVQKIGGSMGIALTATLYGVGLANLIFAPLSEYMTMSAENSILLDTLVIEGVVFIKEKRNPAFMIQALKSYLPREDFDKLEFIIQKTIDAMRAGNKNQANAKTKQGDQTDQPDPGKVA
jgi:chemotaxis protein MotA